MVCGTKRKPKTKPPVKTRTLDSFRKATAKLSKGTEDRLKASYTKRKTAKRATKKAASTKKSDPKISKGVVDRMNEVYATRRLDKRDRKKGGTPRFGTADLRYAAESARRMAGRDMDTEPKAILDKIAVSTKIHDSQHLFITLKLPSGPVGYVAIIDGEDAFDGRRKATSSEYLVELNCYYKRKLDWSTKKLIVGVADLDIMISVLMKHMVGLEMDAKSRRTAAHRHDEAERSKPHAKFVVGGIYKAEWLDKIEVVSRTPKTVTIRYKNHNSRGQKEKRCNIRMYDGEECIYPEGSGYAHAPVTFARGDYLGMAKTAVPSTVTAKLSKLKK